MHYVLCTAAATSTHVRRSQIRLLRFIGVWEGQSTGGTRMCNPCLLRRKRHRNDSTKLLSVSSAPSLMSAQTVQAFAHNTADHFRCPDYHPQH